MYQWLISSWGPRWLHAYRDLGVIHSEAVCTHSSSTSALTAPGEDDDLPHCPGCDQVVVRELAARVGDEPEPAPDWDRWSQ